MAMVNTEVILNSNPTKKLRIAFNKLKENYTEENAKSYSELYKDKPLKFIIENSRYIFSEPYCGYSFYKEHVIENPYALLFTEYAGEREKILNYIEDSTNKIPDEQKKLYDFLCSVVEKKCTDSCSTALILKHGLLNESVRTDYDLLIESVYKLSQTEDKHDLNKTISTLIESIDEPDLFFAITPYITALEGVENPDYLIRSNITRFIKECDISENKIINSGDWQHFIESVVILSKLYEDEIYVESVNKLHRTTSIALESIASESIKTQIDGLTTEYIKESTDINVYYSTSHRAVNQIFEDDDLYSIMAEENTALKENRSELEVMAYSILEEYVTFEYALSDNAYNEIKGYDIFESEATLYDAYNIITEDANSRELLSSGGEPSDIVKAHAGYSDKKNGKPSSTVAQHAGIGGNDKGNRGLSKIKSFADKSMVKAMDADAKHQKSRANIHATGESIKGAAKAGTEIPRGIFNDIKSFFKTWDKMDDDRRRKFIIEPGNRKLILKRLKLSILYGSVAATKLSLLPVVFTIRHYSKMKDKRIRNDLARELETEIRVCEEKINDAASNGDLKEKYRLMRIKSQLEKESLRVRSNSKMI